MTFQLYPTIQSPPIPFPSEGAQGPSASVARGASRRTAAATAPLCPQINAAPLSNLLQELQCEVAALKAGLPGSAHPPPAPPPVHNAQSPSEPDPDLCAAAMVARAADLAVVLRATHDLALEELHSTPDAKGSGELRDRLDADLREVRAVQAQWREEAALEAHRLQRRGGARGGGGGGVVPAAETTISSLGSCGPARETSASATFAAGTCGIATSDADAPGALVGSATPNWLQTSDQMAGHTPPAHGMAQSAGFGSFKADRFAFADYCPVPLVQWLSDLPTRDPRGRFTGLQVEALLAACARSRAKTPAEVLRACAREAQRRAVTLAPQVEASARALPEHKVLTRPPPPQSPQSLQHSFTHTWNEIGLPQRLRAKGLL